MYLWQEDVYDAIKDYDTVHYGGRDAKEIFKKDQNNRPVRLEEADVVGHRESDAAYQRGNPH
jgi:hypothetical protein